MFSSASLLLEPGPGDVREELPEPGAEGVDAVDGGEEGAQQRVALRRAQTVVQVHLKVYHFQLTYRVTQKNGKKLLL